MQKLIFCNDFFDNFLILQDINKMIISHITTYCFFLLMIRYSTYIFAVQFTIHIIFYVVF